MDKKIKNISVIIPVYNEDKYLEQFIDELIKETAKINQIKKIIFVNDGSTDRTAAILRFFQKKNSTIVVLEHLCNQGKGASMKTGLNLAKKNKSEAVIFIDADQQHEPKSLSLFAEKLNHSPVVFGYRNLSNASPFLRRLGNQIAKLLVRSLFHIQRRDLLCGFIAIRKDVFDQINWQSLDYGVETEISTIVGKKRIDFSEINIKNIYLDKNKGVNLFHAFLILARIPFWYFFSPIGIFHPTGGIPSGVIIMVLLGVFGILALKNPFGVRSLAANLEPFPDSLYYSAPAWNFIQGKGFNMKVFGWETEQVVPPLYSIYLLPFFAVFADVRAFYLANLLLAIGSIIMFMFLLKKIFKDNLLTIGLSGLLLVTNFYIYSLPSLLMAENITLFFLISGVYLLMSNVTLLTSILLAVWGTAFWLIKLANLPLGVIFIILATIKILREKTHPNFKKIYFAVLVFAGVIFLIYIFKSGILFIQKGMGGRKPFSTTYFLPNLKLYLTNLFGGQTRYLWYQEKLMSLPVSLFASLGLLIGLLTKRLRVITIRLVLFIVSLVGFISFFYAQDGRYILVILPLWLILSGFFFEFLTRLRPNLIGTSARFPLPNKFQRLPRASIKKIKSIPTVLIILIFIFLIFFTKRYGYRNDERLIITLKKQVSLNLKYKEEPWNFLAVQQFNRFFQQEKYRGGYLGSFLPPYYVDFFTRHNFQYLPVIEDQDFFSEKKGFLKQMGVNDIRAYYKKLLNDNQRVFVSNYYAANLRHWQERFDNLKDDFDLELKQRGCYDVCNIYELKLKF